MVVPEPIYLTATATLEDLRISAREQYLRTKTYVRLPVAIVLVVTIGCITALNGNAVVAGFFFAVAILFTMFLAFVAFLAFVLIPERTWKAMDRREIRSEYTFTSQGFTVVSPNMTLEITWSEFRRYVVLSHGVLIVHKNRRCSYFSQREFGNKYPAFLRLLAQAIPCTAYLDDKLPPQRASLGLMEIR